MIGTGQPRHSTANGVTSSAKCSGDTDAKDVAPQSEAEPARAAAQAWGIR